MMVSLQFWPTSEQNRVTLCSAPFQFFDAGVVHVLDKNNISKKLTFVLTYSRSFIRIIIAFVS